LIKRFRVQNYKALRDVTLELTPIHVLIGPNDSGKTSLLEAMAALIEATRAQSLVQAFPGRWEGRDLVWQHQRDLNVSFSVMCEAGKESADYELECEFGDAGRDIVSVHERAQMGSVVIENTGRYSDSSLREKRAELSDGQERVRNVLRDCLDGVRIHRWSPEHLALPVAPSVQPQFYLEPSGFGLARCLEDILGESREAFDRIENTFRSFFADFSSIKFRRELAYESHPDEWAGPSFSGRPGKGLYFSTRDAGDMPASQVSDGVLLILAYLTLLHLPSPPRVLLIEEPENGVYPKRLGEVIAMLLRARSLQARRGDSLPEAKRRRGRRDAALREPDRLRAGRRLHAR
jgi:hypothetical protein